MGVALLPSCRLTLITGIAVVLPSRKSTRAICRPDGLHLIGSQVFVSRRSEGRYVKARTPSGFTVERTGGTLHAVACLLVLAAATSCASDATAVSTARDYYRTVGTSDWSTACHLLQPGTRKKTTQEACSTEAGLESSSTDRFIALRTVSGLFAEARWLFRRSSSSLLLMLVQLCFGDPATVADSPGLGGSGMAVLPFPGMVIDSGPRPDVPGAVAGVVIHCSASLGHGLKASPTR
jgi:hypothetical protein